MKPSTCNNCPYKDDRCVTDGVWDPKSRVTFLVDTPGWVSVNARKGQYFGSPFMGRTGLLIRKMVQLMKTTYPELDIHYSAAYVSGSGNKSTRASIEACQFIWGRKWISNFVNQLEPHVVIPLGMDAVRALGIPGRKIADLRGTPVSVDIGSREITAVPTLSAKHIYAKPGLINVVLQDVQRAFKIAYMEEDSATQTIEELSSGYAFPETIEEVKDTCDKIIAYYDPEKQSDPDVWPIAVDIETNTLLPYKKDARINIVSFAWDDGKACAITLDHPKAPYDPAEAWPHVKRVLACAKPKTFHNGKFDIKFLEHLGQARVTNFSWDTMLAEHWLDEDKKGVYSLKPLTRSYLPKYANYESGLLDDLTAEQREADNGFEDVDLRKLLPYAGVDADVTRQIHKLQVRKLRRTPNALDECSFVLKNLYLPASRTLGNLEYHGVRLDYDLVARYRTELETLLSRIEADIYGIALQEFNINSNQELSAALLSCGIPTLATTATGQVSNTKSVFETHQKNYIHAAGEPTTDESGCITDSGRLELVEKILLYKSATKMQTGFLTKLDALAEVDGRIHAGFNLSGTATGRLSSSKPNMQNIPKMMCDITRKVGDQKVVLHPGFNVKDLFIPDADDHVFWNADIKAAEIRLLAYYSQDKNLIKAVNDGIDVHTVILTHIKHPDIPPDLENEDFMRAYNTYVRLKDEGDKDVNDFRSAVKRTVFGTLYGARAPKIAEQLGDESPEGVRFAQKIIDAIFKAYPNVSEYMSNVAREVKVDHQVKTAFHRRRRFWMSQMYNSMESRAVREAVNFKIQSTASDLVLMALCDVEENAHHIGASVYLTVHDSMAGTILRENVPKLRAFLDKHIVENTRIRFPELPVPFEYDIEVGPTYGNLTPLDLYMENQ